MVDFLIFITNVFFPIMGKFYLITGKLLIKIFTFNLLDPDYNDKTILAITKVFGFLFYLVLILIFTVF